MTQWYVRELSRISGVSVRALHHYDEIGLLKPSKRLENGYRVYSKEDLETLQKIKALKYFGFNLRAIRNLLKEPVEVRKHFSIQSDLLDRKIKALKGMRDCMEEVLKPSHKNPPWTLTVKLMEMYTMAEKINETWVKDVLKEEEVKELASLKSQYSKKEQDLQSKEWQNLLKQVGEHLKEDPASSIGQKLAKAFITFRNKLYGPDKGHLANKMWEGMQKSMHQDAKGDGQDYGDSIAWISKAMESYYRGQIEGIMEQAKDLNPHCKKAVALLGVWQNLLQEMHAGDEEKDKALDDLLPKDFKGWLHIAKRDF